MTENRLPDYLEHMQQASTDACSFVEGMSKEEFVADKRTQQAVIMNLIIIGEAAVRVMDDHVEFTASHAQIPWRNMRGMRNRVAHGYFDINLDVVWDTIQVELPKLQSQLSKIINELGIVCPRCKSIPCTCGQSGGASGGPSF